MAAEGSQPGSSPPPSRPGGGPSGFVRQLAEALDLPFVLVGAVVAGAAVGYLLDRWLHTAPVLTLVFGAFGFAGGIYEVLRRLTRKQGKN